MTNYFFDSSGLVKYYLEEQGSELVTGVIRSESGHIVYVARITEVESNSAFARSMREGKLSPEAGKDMREKLANEFLKKFIVAELTSSIAHSAIDLLHRFTLRGYDAVQLATALTIQEWLTTKNEDPLIFVSSDHRLLAIATVEGLLIEDPNAHL